jgi:predicted transcriptional regulator
MRVLNKKLWWFEMTKGWRNVRADDSDRHRMARYGIKTISVKEHVRRRTKVKNFVQSSMHRPVNLPILSKRDDAHEDIILEVMRAYEIPLSIKAIADKTNMDWEKAKDTLKKLEKEGLLEEKNFGNKRLWRIKKN